MSKTKVVLRFPTVGKKAGEEIEVDAETAQALVDNGSAKRVSAAQSKKD